MLKLTDLWELLSEAAAIFQFRPVSAGFRRRLKAPRVKRSCKSGDVSECPASVVHVEPFVSVNDSEFHGK